MDEVVLVFPHQLYDHHPALSKERSIFIVEDQLFFHGIKRQIKFHKQKMMLHRATLQAYRDRLSGRGYNARYIAFHQELLRYLDEKDVSRIYIADPVDCILERRISNIANKLGAELKILESPGFLNSNQGIRDFFKGYKHLSQTRFYIASRKSLNILMEEDGRPVGGKWSLDALNRKRLPRNIHLPDRQETVESKYISEAREYVELNFPDHPGTAENFLYPISHEEAAAWLEHFLNNGLANFGSYQDAISRDNSVLFHSQISPLLNIGLLTPHQVVHETVRYCKDHDTPLNSLEGFLRQIIGWREFMRAVYVLQGDQQRRQNFWGHHRPMPASFYGASTGIEPIDRSIQRLQETAYLNHIERLMLLGNFLLLCEINPQEVYRWFMEMFIDAYDWVMVPNVFGMSQYADGGLITTKPYVSSSSYILRMSDYKKGHWCRIWDGLYWRFIFKHRETLTKNPRMRLTVANLDRMDERLRREHLAVAEEFLQKLS